MVVLPEYQGFGMGTRLREPMMDGCGKPATDSEESPTIHALGVTEDVQIFGNKPWPMRAEASQTAAPWGAS